MASRLAVATFFLAVFLPGSAAAAVQSARQGTNATSTAKVTPLQKLLQMLDGLTAKGKEEKHTEQVEFAKFAEWCDNVRATKTKSIKEGAAQIEQLTADILKAESDAKVLSGEITALEASIEKAETEAKTATELREKENADYRKEHLDISESIDACQRAKQALTAKSADVAQSLAQVKSLPKVPAHAVALLQAFLSMHEDATSMASPEANAYEFQSGGVVALIEKLAIKFKDQLLALEKEEMNAKANYQVLIQQLEDNIMAEKASVRAKTAAKAGRLADAATARGDLKVTEATKAEGEKTLAGAIGERRARSEEFERSQATRAEELKVLDKAASAHGKFMDETSEAVAVKETEVEHKEKSRRLTDEKARTTKKEPDLTQDELDRANDYHAKLVTNCVDAGLSYEERVEAREQRVQPPRGAPQLLERSGVG